MSNKEDILWELSYNTYIMLKPSPVEGIGIFTMWHISPKVVLTCSINPTPMTIG